MNEINAFTLNVPLDTSSIKDFEPGQVVKVVARDGKGSFHSQTIEFEERQSVAIFTFPEHPGQLRIYVGPTDAQVGAMSNITWMCWPACVLSQDGGRPGLDSSTFL